ncbi:MAG: right-handed parallel beta-helix repeat-containing protein [Ignavibacteriales bacterium]|nr:right-handed parallel beta-helix repeat-containing protein [Ignavibacteriales bacterium]
MNKYVFTFLILFFSFSSGLNSQIFVSPTGDDLNAGTIDLPFRTLVKAMSVSGPDSLIYMRGGVYSISATISTPKSGTVGKYIKVWAYPGEKPTLDFSAETYGARGIQISQSYWYFKGLEIKNAGDNGIYISGGYNRVEGCVLHKNKDSGLQISGGGNNNLIINCDSYENYDPNTHGGNADGFAPKLDVGAGNEFHGCRSWNNSDDGWDCYGANYASIIDSCWTFRNGINIWGDPSFVGNGNGFKVGGNYTIAPHRLNNCVSFDNVVKGFDQNHNAGGVTLYNCIAWRNSRNYSFPDTLRSGINIVKNNISFQSISTSVSFNSRFTDQSNNSWQGFTVATSDFLSFDTSLAVAPRKPDGSLPGNDFLHLAASSAMVNAGIDIGLPYRGSAPDLGAFETGSFPLYSLNINSINGSVTKIPNRTLYDSGASVQLSAIPSSKYHFSGWSGDLVDTLNPVVVVMDGNKNITANFYPDQFSLSVSAINGSVLKSPDLPVYDFGSSVQLTAIPNEGYNFTYWSGDINGGKNPVFVNVDTSKNITANFTIRTFKIIASSNFYGSIVPNDTIITAYNGSQSFKFNPDPYFHVDSVLVDGNYVSDSITGYTFYNVISDHTVKVIFGAESFAFNFNDGWNLISIPIGVPDLRMINLFPEAISPAFSFDGSYQIKDTLEMGNGYWVKFSQQQTQQVSGDPILIDTIAVKIGWNLIGSITVPVPITKIVQNPNGIIVSSFFGYNGTYTATDTIAPGRAYWVKISADGELILSQ